MAPVEESPLESPRAIVTPRTNPRRNPAPKPVASAPAPPPSSIRRPNKHAASNEAPASEPPKKKQKLRYIPGGPGGGGRYVDDATGLEIPVGGTGPGGYNYIGPRGRVGQENAKRGVVPVVYPSRRDRSQRTRTSAPRTQPPPARYSSSSAAQMAAAQSEGYKPREERSWDEFHPNLDIDAPLRAFSADEVEGILPESRPVTPAHAPQSTQGSIHAGDDAEAGKATSDGGRSTPSGSTNSDLAALTIKIPGTPGGGKRKPGRPPKDPVAFFTARALKENPGVALQVASPAPKTPIALPVQNTNPKEKLTLPQPSYTKSDTLKKFEDKSLGFERYVEQSMANVGYQVTDLFVRPDSLINTYDIILGEERRSDMRVEYDMDEQDCQWLKAYNTRRKAAGFEEITREIFEITMTKIEKEWHLLEKQIPKPNPKPPQTHRPRSSSAAAVNGEPQAGEEQDSKCAICDDGDCENTNAIVFCDGCDLAVHQECYGVPFIPEGQWLCRKCQLIGRAIPTCIFCPNTDGAFKQTNSSKWAHLLCAMWIPEVSLGNHSFMEPVMEVEKVPRSRWKLRCYICNQNMGACIQCGKKNCFRAFHVTCARKARLFLKMKNNHGTLSVLDGNTPLKAFCDEHCPVEHKAENDVVNATRDAQRFYKKTMKGRLWADSQASASVLAAEQQAVTQHQADESQLTGEKVSQTLADSKKKGTQPSNVWKLPSGAPVIPRIIYDVIESSLQRFNVRKRKDYAADACKYWTLKREARRGAPLLKRLQLQSETFSSTELARRNYPAMGHAGRPRLERRVQFADSLLKNLEDLMRIVEDTKERDRQKLAAAELNQETIDFKYFPVARLLPPIVKDAKRLDEKNKVFTDGLLKLEEQLNSRAYVLASVFSHDFSEVIRAGVVTDVIVGKDDKSSPSQKPNPDLKDRQRLARRIIKAVTPQFEAALQVEADFNKKTVDPLIVEMKELFHRASELVPAHVGAGGTLIDSEQINGDTMIIDSPTKASPSKRSGTRRTNGIKPEEPAEHVAANESVVIDDLMDIDAPGEIDDTQVNSASSADDAVLTEVNANAPQPKQLLINGVKDTTSTPPDTNGYVSAPEVQQPDPPTPPISNGGIGVEAAETLTKGGVPWVFQDLDVEGTNEQGETWADGDAADSEELSDMDDEELRGLGADVEVGGEGREAAVAGAGANAVVRAKKGKAKKRRRGW